LNFNFPSPWTFQSTSSMIPSATTPSSTTPTLPAAFFFPNPKNPPSSLFQNPHTTPTPSPSLFPKNNYPSANNNHHKTSKISMSESIAIPPMQVDSNGNSPLTSAVFHNDFLTVRTLIEQHHLPLNLQNYEGETALSYAVMNNNLEMTKFLIDRGADLNTANCRAESPLHQAVVIGNLEIARGLVEGGSYIDAEDECGETPLHFAVREDQAEIVEYLLSVGADPDHSNHDDETPAELAEMVASDEVKKVFLDNCKRYVDGNLSWNNIQNILGSKSHLLLQKSQKKLTSSSLLSPLSLSCNIPIRPHL